MMENGLTKLVEIFQQSALNRAFELEVARAYDDGVIKCPIYLSLGTEHIPASIAAVTKEWIVFPQHRCHSYALTFRGNPLDIARQIAFGPQGSASLNVPDRIFGHSGLLGDNAAIAVGAAKASGKPTLCILGDAAVEEDYVLGALGYAATHRPPVLFIVEDNDLSILTPKAVRRTWDIIDVAQSFGINSICEISDDPLNIMVAVKNLSKKLPAILSIECCRHCWHVGTGNDGTPEWDSYKIMKETLIASESGAVALEVEAWANVQMEIVWNQIRSEKNNLDKYLELL